MAYLKQNISFYGTEDNFLLYLKKIFTENEVLSMNCTDENFSTYPHYIVLSSGNLRLKIASLASFAEDTQKAFRLSIGFVNDGSESITWLFVNNSINFSGNYLLPSAAANRQQSLLIIKTGTGTAINIGGYNSVAGKGNFNIFIVENEDAKLHTYSNGIDTYAKVISNNNADFYFRPHHICGKNSNEFFLDCEISALYTSNNAFITHSTDITGLGGAVAKNFYIMTNGDKYYAVADNIAIRLGEEVVIDEE